MGGCCVDGPNAPSVKSPEEMAGRFYTELTTNLVGWKERLSADPSQLDQVEREVHAAFSRGGDLMVVGLVGRSQTPGGEVRQNRGAKSDTHTFKAKSGTASLGG